MKLNATLTARAGAILLAVLLVFTPREGHAAERFAVTVSGQEEGRNLLLIPGLASSDAVWDETVAHYEDRFRLHAFRFAGFAGLPAIEGPVLEPMIASLVTYLEDEDLTDTVLIGHSMGGYTAMAVALRAPERVAKVVVVDSIPFLGQLFLGAEDATSAKPGAAQLRDGTLAMDEETYKARQAFNARVVQATAPRDVERVLDWVLASDRQAVATGLYDLLTADLRADLTDMKAEGLVLYAYVFNPRITVEQMDRLYAAQYANWDDVRLTRIDGSKHFIMLDQTERFLGELDAFLED